MAVLTVTQIVRTKVPQTLAAAAGGGDSFPNQGNVMLAIRNAGGGAINLTIVVSGAVCSYGLAAASHNEVVSIPNDSVVQLIGPFPSLQFNDANGRVQLTYSGVTSVTVAAFSLPPAA